MSQMVTRDSIASLRERRVHHDSILRHLAEKLHRRDFSNEEWSAVLEKWIDKAKQSGVYVRYREVLEIHPHYEVYMVAAAQESVVLSGEERAYRFGQKTYSVTASRSQLVLVQVPRKFKLVNIAKDGSFVTVEKCTLANLPIGTVDPFSKAREPKRPCQLPSTPTIIVWSNDLR